MNPPLQKEKATIQQTGATHSQMYTLMFVNLINEHPPQCKKWNLFNKLYLQIMRMFSAALPAAKKTFYKPTCTI